MNKDAVQAASWYRKATDQQNLSDLNHLCQSGHGVGRDLKTALALFQKAAAKGYVPAQTNLGLMYKTGVGWART